MKQEHILNTTVKWMIKECQLITATESPSYQAMMTAAYTQYKNISRKQVKAKLFELSRKVRTLVRKHVEQNTISITSDHWTSISKHNYEYHRRKFGSSFPTIRCFVRGSNAVPIVRTGWIPF